MPLARFELGQQLRAAGRIERAAAILEARDPVGKSVHLLAGIGLECMQRNAVLEHGAPSLAGGARGTGGLEQVGTAGALQHHLAP